MKPILRLALAAALLGPSGVGQAQTVDPSFAATELYAPAHAEHIAQQVDGKIVLVGPFTRVNNAAAGRVARYNADYTPDATFNANAAGLRGDVVATKPLASGKLLVVGEGPLTLGAVTRQDLLRLNADGTPDATFDAGTASSDGTGQIVCPLPSGKLLVAGDFVEYNGLTRRYLVRLNADGSLDNTFTAPALDNTVYRVLLQPDGQILVAGIFTSPLYVARLTANGSLDPSFTSPFRMGSTGATVMSLQVDGKILVGGLGNFSLTGFTNQTGPLVRLQADGSWDSSFQPTTVQPYPFFGYPREFSDPLPLPGGQVITNGTNNLAYGLQRLNANGAVDATFQTTLGPLSYVWTLLRPATGGLLVAGVNLLVTSTQIGAALLQANGANDPAWAPKLQSNGSVWTLALQPDGKVVAGGSFTEVNGAARGGLARFLADGTLDTSLQASLPTSVAEVFVQPDGKLLTRTGFNQFTNEPESLTRVLASGAADPAFQLPSFLSYVRKAALLPNGNILVLADSARQTTSGPSRLWRLRPDGSYDNTFRQRVTAGFLTTFLVQPNGNILLAGDIGAGATYCNVARLLPSGALDPSFTSPPSGDWVQQLALQSTGAILISTPRLVSRLLPSGQPDASFTPVYATSPNFYMAPPKVQPNDRILLSESSALWRRLLPTGVDDPTFVAPTLDGVVSDFVTQPDGKLLAGGYFSTVAGSRRMGLARFVAANVLAVPAARPQPLTQAWPVPAREQLHLQLDAAARPGAVGLYDLQGRLVLSAQPAAALTLDVRPLPAGAYLLRVDYAEGPVTRRVVVE